MRNFAILFFLILFSFSAFGQKPIRNPVNSPKSANLTKTTLGGEKEEFEQASAQTDAAERLNSLKKFVTDFPKSAEQTRALELIAATRAQIADEKIRAGDAAGGIELFKLAVRDAPAPISDRLFADVILQIPNNLFFGGERAAAAAVAEMIEKKVEGSAKQLLGLATFYLAIENADEAKRLAEKALAIEPNLPAAYQTLGLANRLNFNLEEAASAYTKALELDANSTVSRRSLAEMQRALGKSDEAVELYREILSKDAADASAQNGLILSLFDAGKKPEAETEMTKSLAENPNNLFLLVGASYWYAAHNDGARAIELAQKAVAAEPRFVWGYIALARGHLHENHFLEAERALLAARSYGNFPTLDYELASARLAAGFYREAAQELSKNFVVKDDLVATKLGGRVEKQAKTFTDLISLERQASIFEPTAADNAENSQTLKSLLDFYQKLESSGATDAEVSDAADKFLNGNDKMKLHRRLFVADRLLEKKKALPKVTELMKAAVGEVDGALDVPNPAAAVLADELFESRARAIAKNELVIVPTVPRQTLSNILRGRIEEISGRALYDDNKPAAAVVRLKRAVSILPEKSAWWYSSMWRLGSALQADGQPKEALDAYIKGYAVNDASTAAKRIIIEGLYQQVNGSLDGLDAKIGAKPETVALNSPAQTGQTETVAPTVEKQNPIVENVSKGEAVAPPSVEVKPAPEVSAKVESTPLPTPVAPTVAEPKPTPETTITATSSSKVQPTPEITPAPEPEAKTETKTIAKQTEIVKNPPAENDSAKTQKPLFEPVIITVPKPEVPTKTKTDARAEENPPSIKPEDKTADPTGKTTDENLSSGSVRPRIVADANQTAEAPKCALTVSQENVSLLNNGGNLGIFVGFEGETGDVKGITVSSSSPKDIKVVFEPEIGASSNRMFFIIKSVSANTGVYTVTFESPCGQKEVNVKVR
ncbi:MAG: hypothetical protein M3033_15075 [Acidobacteriota bacterium]|nr:hypothetical protein [Acidobacteriota bacterium]